MCFTDISSLRRTASTVSAKCTQVIQGYHYPARYMSVTDVCDNRLRICPCRLGFIARVCTVSAEPPPGISRPIQKYRPRGASSGAEGTSVRRNLHAPQRQSVPTRMSSGCENSHVCVGKPVVLCSAQVAPACEQWCRFVWGHNFPGPASNKFNTSKINLPGEVCLGRGAIPRKTWHEETHIFRGDGHSIVHSRDNLFVS